MTQIELDLTTPPVETMARRRDPDTSHEAARDVDDSGQRRAENELILDLVRRHPGLTYREIHARLVDRIQEPAEVMRRLSHDLAPRHPVTREELPSALVIRGEKRRCRYGDRPMTTWWPRS